MSRKVGLPARNRGILGIDDLAHANRLREQLVRHQAWNSLFAEQAKHTQDPDVVRHRMYGAEARHR